MDTDRILHTFRVHGVGDIKLNEPMRNYTTWRIGGPADVFVAPTNLTEVRGAILAAKELGIPCTAVGKGSNLLVLDGGIRGLVLRLGDQFADIQVDGHRLTVLSGRSYPSVASIAIRNGLAGLEFAVSIPGTVGGAVMMNAGAHGGQTEDVLEWADVMDDDGNIRRLSKSDLNFGYRYSILKDHPMVVVQAGFLLEPGDTDEMTAKARAWKERRSATQPLSQPNCGSVFRNPTGTHAGHLIETAGLKGLRHGDAMVSDKHANFIVNLGDARAEDVLWVIQHVQENIKEKFGVVLETEVRILGEPISGGWSRGGV